MSYCLAFCCWMWGWLVGIFSWDRGANEPDSLQAVTTPTPPLIDSLVAGVQEKEVDGEPISRADRLGGAAWDAEAGVLVLSQPDTPLRSEISF